MSLLCIDFIKSVSASLISIRSRFQAVFFCRVNGVRLFPADCAVAPPVLKNCQRHQVEMPVFAFLQQAKNSFASRKSSVREHHTASENVRVKFRFVCNAEYQRKRNYDELRVYAENRKQRPMRNLVSDCVECVGVSFQAAS